MSKSRARRHVRRGLFVAVRIAEWRRAVARSLALVSVTAAALAFFAPAAPAQTPDSTAARTATADSTRPMTLPMTRASWTSDRIPLRAGDLVTVVVDEQTAARERVSKVATGDRSQRNDLHFNSGDSDTRVQFGTGMETDSRDVGEANRLGDLTAVLTVRVVSIAENGVAQIEGAKKVTVDGRLQEVTLKGAIRTADVDAHNRVLSERIADAVITYKGKKIGPRTGIIGKILGILWP